MTDTDFFGHGGGYLRLTSTDQYERASAFWVNDLFVADQWTVEMEIRIGVSHDGSELPVPDGADGLAFTWIDASTTSGGSELLGGYGDWMGTPRGSTPGGGLGYLAGVEGYSFQFDHLQNAGEPSQEFVGAVDISDWSLVGGSLDLVGDTGFYLNDGWQRVRLTMNGGALTFDYNWNGATYDNSQVFNIPNYQSFDGYFGITGATGERRAYHEIRNFRLDALLVPEPGTMALLLVGLGAGGAWIRRRRKES